MRYFSYDEYSDFDLVVTLSEDDIRKDYWPWWKERMIKKYGEVHFNENFCFEDCLDDWKIVNRAWEVKG